jgi:hypothetical protein
MNSEVGKGFTYIFRKAVLISSLAVPIFFVTCKKDDPPKVKSMTQSVVLTNDVEIKYSATLSNIDKAELKVKKEGVLISSEEINVASTGAVYVKIFSYSIDPRITKGNYELTLTSDNLEKKDVATIPNYPSEINISGINFNLNEHSQINVTLPAPTDKNPEDNPVSIKGVKSIEGKTQVILNGNNLSIKAPYTYFGPYQLELELGSAGGGLEKKILQGQIIEYKKINPFVQPNDSTSNWYGSGDVDNDNLPLNEKDLTRLNELIAGTYSNPSDIRLRDRADVNGDGFVNSQDAQLLQNKINGSMPYLPSEWNKLQTRPEKEDWAKKMFAIDKTNTTAFPGGDCVQFSDQAYINFHGVNLTNISKFLEVYSYDFTNNGRFNLPLLEVITQEYDAVGKPLGGHAMNAFIFGNASNFENVCPIEPQKDHFNIKFGEDYLIGINSKFYLRGPPIIRVVGPQNGKKIIEMPWYVKYTIKDKIPTWIWTNPDLITQK